MPYRAQPSYLHFRGRTYYFRIAVPLNLVPVLGRRGYKKSLRTGDYRLACFLAQKYTLFVQKYFEYIRAMIPTTQDIDLLIRNHFEKCLMEAEERIWMARHDLAEGMETTEDLHNGLENLEEDYQRLKDLQFGWKNTPNQERIAKELLGWKQYDISHLDNLYKKLLKGIMEAHLEASRLHIAYIRRDHNGMNIQNDFFDGCYDYLQKPDGDLYLEYADKPYHGGNPERKPFNLSEAVELYFKYKRRETKDWHQANRAYMERLTDMLGQSTALKSLSKQDGIKLEDALWEIPANYKKLYSDIPLKNFLAGKQGEYERISEPTVFNYWMSIRAFFEWCKEREYMPLNILADVKLNTRRSGKVKQEKRRSYTSEELKVLFSCPLFTGHKYENREHWMAGDILKKNGNYWIPLVGLFAGVRLGEALYLQIKDIKSENGILYIDINKEEGKSLKTEQSARKIPVHPTLKVLGFHDYYEKRKLSGNENDRLFDGITFPENGKITKNFSRNFSKLLENIGLKKGPQLTFHSLRHNYVDALRRVPGISVEVMDPLDGRNTTGNLRGSRKGYGQDFSPAELYPFVEKMDFRVDLSHLEPTGEDK